LARNEKQSDTKIEKSLNLEVASNDNLVSFKQTGRQGQKTQQKPTAANRGSVILNAKSDGNYEAAAEWLDIWSNCCQNMCPRNELHVRGV
jgi:hypothetical protein